MKSRNRLDVVYVHHGAQRPYDSVSAILAAGFSCRLLCGYYYHPDGLFERFVGALPGPPFRRLTARLKRRHSDRLDPAATERSLFQEALAGLETGLRRLLPNFIAVRNRYIDLRAALRVLMLRPRIVIACDTHALWTLRAAKRVGAIAILDQVIGHLAVGTRLLTEETRLHPEIGTSFRPLPDRFIRRCIAEAREAEYALAASAYVRDSLVEIGVDEARIFILPYGADLDLFGREEEPPRPPFLILFAGHIGLRKGVHYLLEAVREAALADARVILLGKIEGDGDWLAPYRDLFDHIPHVAHREIPEIFARAHVYVFPTLHEGSTVSVYEAMATGLPVITTPNAGSVVRDGEDGFIVNIRDVAALRDRIRLLHDDDALRGRMGKSARRRAREFTWETYSARLAAILNRVLE